MKNLLYNLSLFFLLCSCSTQQNDSATLLHVALDKATEDIRTSSFLDTTYCQPIVLEQTQYPIGEISKIQYVNGLFFIMDKHGQKLFSFDEKGKCNLLLDKLGKSSREYVEMRDFYVCDSSIYILDYPAQKILVYDINGMYKKTIKMKDISGNFIFADSNSIYLVNEYSDTPKGKFHLFKTDLNGNYISAMITFDELGQFSDDYYTRCGNMFIYGGRPDNILYSLTDNSSKSFLTFDFGEKSMPKELYSLNDLELLEKGIDEKYIRGVNGYFGNSRYLFLEFLNEEFDKYHAIYDFNTHKIESIGKDIYCDFKYYAPSNKNVVSDHYMYSIVEFDYFVMWSENAIQHSPFISLDYKKKLETLKNKVESNGNPVIFKYKFK